MGTNLLHNPGITPEQAAALKGVWFSDAFFEGDPNPAVQAFVGNYRQQYGEAPDYLAAQGYLLVRLFGRLAKSGGPRAAPIWPLNSHPSRATPTCPGSGASTARGKRKRPSTCSPSKMAGCKCCRPPPPPLRRSNDYQGSRIPGGACQ